MSTVKSKKLQVGTDATSSNNFTIYQPATPDGTLRIGVGNADSPTEVGRFNSSGYVATNAPAFSAYNNTNTSFTANTLTKIIFNVEDFDTNSNYNTTNYRFTPSVAGYYQVNLSYKMETVANRTVLSIFKNGSEYKRMIDIQSTYTRYTSGSCLVYLNGTTDYIEAYGLSAATLSGVANSLNQFSAYLARAA